MMLDPKSVYPIWTPYDSFDAAKTLLDELDASKLESAEDTFRELESIRNRSQLTDAQAVELAAEIDQAVWNDLRQTFSC
jgi:hypothetical protein